MSIETALSSLLQQQSALINTFYTQVDTWNNTVNSLAGNISQVLQSGIQNALAISFYVDATDGNDSNNGSQNAPFKTIAKAINSVPSFVLGTIYLKAGQTHNIASDIVIDGKKIAFNGYDFEAVNINVSNPNHADYITKFTSSYRTYLPKIRQMWTSSIVDDSYLVRGYWLQSWTPGRFATLSFSNCQFETFTAPSNVQATGNALTTYKTHPNLGFLYAPSQYLPIIMSNCDIVIKEDNFICKSGFSELTPLSLYHCRVAKMPVVNQYSVSVNWDAFIRYLYKDQNSGIVVIQFNEVARLGVAEGFMAPTNLTKPFADLISIWNANALSPNQKHYLTNFVVE